MHVELALHMPLIKEALAALLMTAGFAVSKELGELNEQAIIIIDADDCRDPAILAAHRARGEIGRAHV